MERKMGYLQPTALFLTAPPTISAVKPSELLSPVLSDIVTVTLINPASVSSLPIA
jgi:hypothetical protein